MNNTSETSSLGGFQGANELCMSCKNIKLHGISFQTDVAISNFLMKVVAKLGNRATIIKKKKIDVQR